MPIICGPKLQGRDANGDPKEFDFEELEDLLDLDFSGITPEDEDWHLVDGEVAPFVTQSQDGQEVVTWRFTRAEFERPNETRVRMHFDYGVLDLDPVVPFVDPDADPEA